MREEGVVYEHVFLAMMMISMMMMIFIENDYIAESMTVCKLSVDFVFMSQLRTSRSMSLKFHSNLSIV
jgi:hypothetical protein